MAEHLTYYGYDEDRPVTCPGCGWNGPAKDGSQGLSKELFDVSCPRCDTMLLIVSLPTVEETKEAAARGDARAQADLGYALRVRSSCRSSREPSSPSSGTTSSRGEAPR